MTGVTRPRGGDDGHHVERNVRRDRGAEAPRAVGQDSRHRAEQHERRQLEELAVAEPEHQGVYSDRRRYRHPPLAQGLLEEASVEDLLDDRRADPHDQDEQDHAEGTVGTIGHLPGRALEIRDALVEEPEQRPVEQRQRDELQHHADSAAPPGIRPPRPQVEVGHEAVALAPGGDQGHPEQAEPQAHLRYCDERQRQLVDLVDGAIGGREDHGEHHLGPGQADDEAEDHVAEAPEAGPQLSAGRGGGGLGHAGRVRGWPRTPEVSC